MIGAEQPMCRSVSGEGYIPVGINLHLQKAYIPYAPCPQIGCEAALCKVLAPPAEFQKLPCTATAVQKARKVFAPNPAVAVQGSSGR